MTGAVFGCIFIYTMDDFYYNSFRRNIGEPAAVELKKEQIDAAEVSRVVMRGMKQTYRELWP